MTSQVPIQIKICREPHPATLVHAGERLLARVCTNVAGQTTLYREPHPTILISAKVRLFAGVHAHMIVQIALRSEPLSTTLVRATERSFIGVCAHVDGQLRRRSDLLLAYLAALVAVISVRTVGNRCADLERTNLIAILVIRIHLIPNTACLITRMSVRVVAQSHL